MGGDDSRWDVLLAVALGSHRQKIERRMLPDRRSGIDRRKNASEVTFERRSQIERRQTIRRGGDREEGAGLLQKARTRMTRKQRKRTGDDSGNGLR